MSMAIQVSPGINVSEFDTTTVIPAVSTSVGAVAGVFQWGPGYQRTLIDSENTLVQKFGKPTASNFETFFTAANFLAYGNALYVVRAYDATALNAVANTAAMTAPQIDNADDWRDNFVANAAAYANAAYIAKFPGTLGNSLKVSVCDSTNAYSSNLAAPNTSTGVAFVFTPGSNQISVLGGGAAAGDANSTVIGVVGQISVGDYIKAGNSTVGYQYVKVTAKSTSNVEATANATVNVATGNTYYSIGTLVVDNKISLSSEVKVVASSNVATGVSRFWEFYNAVDKAPGISTFMTSQGLTTQDELHIVVSDAGGKFSGTQNSILEVWSNLSRATDAKTTAGATNYYKNVIDAQSAYVFAGTARSTSGVGLASAITAASNTTPYSATFNLGTDGAAESAISLGPVALAYDLFADKADVDLSLVMQGKAIGNTVGGLSNYIIANIAENRKDCVAFISPDLSIVTNAQTRDPVQYAVDFRASTGGIAGLSYNSSYAVMDTGYKYQYDKYNDLYRWVPLNGDIAGLCALTDQTRDSWYSPAGFNRGQIKNVVKLQFNPNQAQRDLLYKNDVNPVVQFPGQGTVLYGDKTLLGKPSAFDRINVRRLFITLEKAIENASRSSLFEFNDSFTRAQFKNLVEPFLRQVQGRRGIFDFRVVCDETNNTGQVIDSNQFVGDIYIKPAKSINFIQLNFVAVRTGVDFNTIVGQF
jgi:hypothetical protein